MSSKESQLKATILSLIDNKLNLSPGKDEIESAHKKLSIDIVKDKSSQLKTDIDRNFLKRFIDDFYKDENLSDEEEFDIKTELTDDDKNQIDQSFDIYETIRSEEYENDTNNYLKKHQNVEVESDETLKKNDSKNKNQLDSLSVPHFILNEEDEFSDIISSELVENLSSTSKKKEASNSNDKAIDDLKIHDHSLEDGDFLQGARIMNSDPPSNQDLTKSNNLNLDDINIDIPEEIDKDDKLETTHLKSSTENFKEINNSVDVTREPAFYYQRLYKRLLSFPEAERLIIYQALVKNHYPRPIQKELFDLIRDERSLQTIIDFLLKNRFSDNINQKLEELKYQKQEKSSKVLLSPSKWIIEFIKSPFVIGIFLFLLIIALIGVVFQQRIRGEYYYSKAISEFNKINSQQEKYYFDKAFSYYPSLKRSLKFTQKYLSNREYDKAEDMYFFLRDIFGDENKLLMYDVGQFYLQIKRYKDSEKVYSNIINIYPEDEQLISAWGEMYLSWGDVNRSQYERSKNIFKSLLKNNKNKKYYIAKLMELETKTQQDQEAIKLFNYLNNLDENYLEVKSHTIFLNFLIDKYKLNSYQKQFSLENLKNNFSLVHTKIRYIITTLSQNLYERYPDYLPIYTINTKWYVFLKDYKHGERLMQEAFTVLEKKGSLKTKASQSEMYSIMGEIKYKQNKVSDSLYFLNESLKYDKLNTKANYYQGLIHLNDLNQIYQANEYLKIAEKQNGLLDAYQNQKLLSALAYINYKLYLEGLNKNEDTQNNVNYLDKSIVYWLDLMKYAKRKHGILYALGSAYAYKGDYKLAIGYLKSSESLLGDYANLETQENSFFKQKLAMLSDVYNNIAVVHSYEKFLNATNSYYNKEKEFQANKYFIDSIALKDKINENKGKVFVNYKLFQKDKYKINDLHIIDKYISSNLDELF